jgi:HAD superfamily hydrolase (TIGR01509 family)
MYFVIVESMKTKLVLFDAAGVLFVANTVVGDYLKNKYGLSQEEQNLMWKGFYQDYTIGKINTEEFLDIFARTYNLSRSKVTTEIFTDSFNNAMLPVAGIEDVLKKLKNKDIALAMLSDTTEMFASARKSGLLSNYFDHVFLSYELGFRKPDKRAFKAVTDFYNLEPSEIFFIDDNESNVFSAIDFGMKATVFKSSKELEAALIENSIL